jgi:hypothetical protein
VQVQLEGLAPLVRLKLRHHPSHYDDTLLAHIVQQTLRYIARYDMCVLNRRYGTVFFIFSQLLIDARLEPQQAAPERALCKGNVRGWLSALPQIALVHSQVVSQEQCKASNQHEEAAGRHSHFEHG